MTLEELSKYAFKKQEESFAWGTILTQNDHLWFPLCDSWATHLREALNLPASVRDISYSTFSLTESTIGFR